MSSEGMTGLGWRLDVLKHKLSGRAAGVTWQVFFNEVGRRREFAWKSPSIEVVEDGGDLHRVDVVGTSYWFPREVTPHLLQGLYKLTHHPSHPHYFESDHCQVKPDDVVIDAGAFEGFFSRFVLDRGGKVIAVEPLDAMAEALRRNFAPEIKAGRMVVVPAVLCGQTGSTHLVINPNEPLGATMSDAEVPGLVSQPVAATTIDDLIANSPWGRCNFVKMDIEGAERDAVGGAGETIRRDRPQFSIAVYHAPMTYCEIAGDIKGLNVGYRVEGKGLVFGLDGVWRPLMLHAWPAVA